MKHMRKILALALAVMLVMSLATSAFAQTVDTNQGGTATITVENASKGETYAVYKLFDASATGNEDGSIVYTGTIPAALAGYFEEVDGYIKAKEDELSADAIAAMIEWTETQSPVASAKSDGTALEFTELEYGYYVVTTTQGTAISVDSTNPNAVIYDKNGKTPSIVKQVDDQDVAIGQTVTYTATSTVYNYLGEGEDAKQVIYYEISDTLPEFLSNVTVTSIVIDNDGKVETTDDQITLETKQFDENKKIVIDWVDANGNSLYNNGALIIVTYTAVVTDKAVVDGTVGNINVVTLQPYVEDGDDDDENPDPWKDHYDDDEVIYTYAAALKKVDENGDALAGAKFAANGLTVTGSKGYYTVVSYDPTSTVLGTEMETDDNGHLVIVGLTSDVTLVVTETEAPAGYNKITDTISLTPTKIGEVVTVTSTTIYYDAEGNVTEEVTTSSTTTIEYNEKLKEAAVKVENKKGVELPSTGGIGTTIFYVLGGVLVLAAVVLLVTKKRMAA